MPTLTGNMRILMTQLVPDDAVDTLRQAVGSTGRLDINPDADRIWTKQELIDKLKASDYNALYCMLTNPIDAEVMDAAPNIKIIANMAVGYNNVDVAEATRRGIVVSNTPGVLTDTTADFAWTLLMGVARRLVEGDRFARAGRFHGWGPLMMVGQDVHGKTLGIVGFGRIGRTLAKRATGFDMKVLYFDLLRADPDTEKALNASPVSMDDLLSQSDYVSLHTDYNPKSHHLIGAPGARQNEANRVSHKHIARSNCRRDCACGCIEKRHYRRRCPRRVRTRTRYSPRPAGVGKRRARPSYCFRVA